jgi:hypothetical protein
VRHIRDLLLSVIDGGDDRGRELFEQVCKTVFLRRCLAGSGAALGLSGDAAIGIETAESAVAFLEDAAALFDQRLDVVDELFFVEFVARRAVSLFNILWTVLAIASLQ